MSKKMDIEYIRSRFDDIKCILKSIVYVNNRTKLDYLCPEGHECSISWHDFKPWPVCPQCSGKAKNTTQSVSDEFKERGWILKSEYLNSTQKLRYICTEGVEHTITWGAFKRNHKCPCLSKHSIPSIEYIKGFFEMEDCELESTEYISSKQTLDYTCKYGNKHSVMWNNFQQGTRCRCGLEKQGYTTEQVIKQFQDRNYVLETKEYINNKQILDYICANGKRHSITFSGFLKNEKCACYSENAKHEFDFIKSEFDAKGLIVTSTEYINNSTKLDYVCKKRGHKGSMTYICLTLSKGCAMCSNDECAIRMTGEGSPFWRGGISFDSYCDAWADKEYKLDIKQRDSRCQNPYCKCNGGSLCLHHIDYDKQNCHPNNLILLCSSCHSYSNHNRDWHKSWYQTIMANKHGYMY